MIQRLFGFERRLWSMGLCSLRFVTLSNLGIYSPKDYLNQGVNISERSWWDGNSLLHRHLRESVDGHFGYPLFCLNLHEKEKYVQSSIQPRLEWSWGWNASKIKPDGLGMFQDRFISILDITASIPSCEIAGFVLKLKIFRSKDLDLRSWTHTHCSLIYFWFPFTLITWESAIHFSDSQNSS